ncbi:MAG: thioredoxin [Patescibacteria group bacterium]|nr:thioredoxin [Patescibacteria group bacterium]
MKFTKENFSQEVEKANGLVLVDFFAEWCGPCKLLSPIIEELADEYKDKNVKIGKFNVEDSEEISNKYNVMGVPMLILFKNGEIVEQATGLKPKQEIKDIIEKNL